MNYFGTIILEHVKNDRKYLLVIPNGAPFQEAHEAAIEMASGILEIKKQQEELLLKAQEVNTEPTNT